MDGVGKPLGVPHARPSARPKAWQQLWLDKQREVMLKRLQGHVMDIADRLVREGDMDPSLDEAYQFIVSQDTVPVEKVRCLLDFLRKKPPETFDHFQAALCEFGCEDLAVRLSDSEGREPEPAEGECDSLSAFERLSLSFPASVEKARNLLKTSYVKAAEKVHVLEGLSRSREGCLKDLDDIFVNIGLVSSDDVEKLCSEWTGKDGGVEEVMANALVARQVSLCDLWQAGERSKKEPDSVIALGTAGSGKTLAFTMKASYEWCGGKFWEQMALLRTIRCRDKSVWRAGTVSELFKLRELGLSAVEEKEVEAFIVAQPAQVALVCDGLDEGSVDKDSFLWRVLCGECLPGFRIVVTSRPCAAVTDLSQDGAIDRHLQLFGFNNESVHAFIIKYLGAGKGKKMLEQLAESLSILSLMHTPFFALLICEQFKDEGQLPRRRSDIFNRVTLRLVQRFAKQQRFKATFKSVEKAPGQLLDKVLEVGKVAFDRLKQKDLSYFELEDGDLSEEAIRLGFLEHVQAMSLSEEDQYGFRHLTVQEYLAALYASKRVLKKEGDVARLAEELGCGKEAGHLNTFWVFVAGLVDNSLREELFCAIAETDMQTVARSMDASERIAGVDSAVESTVGTYGERRNVAPGETGISRQTDQKSANDQLDLYRYLLLLHCFAEGVAGSSGKPSACVKYVLKRHGVNGTKFVSPSRSDWSVVSKVMEYHGDSVECANIHSFYFGDDGLQLLLPGLLSCTHLQVLCLAGNELSFAHMGTVGDVLSRNCQSLEKVNLCENPAVGDEGLRRVGEGLLRLQRLKKLRLGNLSLTHHSSRLLANVISRQPALQKVAAYENNIGDIGFVAIGRALQRCQSLVVLGLRNTGLTCSSMRLLASVLAKLPSLYALDLRGIQMKANGFEQLAPGLQQCSRLERLLLDNCGLTDHGQVVPWLTLVLLSLPKLKKFSLSGNQIGDSGLRLLAVGLEESHQLINLWLDNIGMTSPDSMSTIIRLLKRLDKLQSLHLDDNPFTRSSKDMKLYTVVKGHPSLRLLWASRSTLSPDAVSRLRSCVNDSTCVLNQFEAW